MAQTSFDIDEKTAASLEHLKRVYGVPTNAAVLRRALAIALAASKFADDDYNIHIESQKEDGEKQKIVVPQRL